MKRGKQNKKSKVQGAIPGIRGKIPSSSLNGQLESTASGANPFLKTRLRYTETFTVTSTAGVPNFVVLILNDGYDPYTPVTGGQYQHMSENFDTYQHAVIPYVRTTFRGRNTSASQGQFLIRLDGSITPITVTNQVLGYGLYVEETLESKNLYGSTQTLRMTVDNAKHYGSNRAGYRANPNFWFNAAASPTEKLYVHCGAFSDAADNITIEVRCTFDADFIFFEPRTSSLALEHRLAREMHTIRHRVPFHTSMYPQALRELQALRSGSARDILEREGSFGSEADGEYDLDLTSLSVVLKDEPECKTPAREPYVRGSQPVPKSVSRALSVVRK